MGSVVHMLMAGMKYDRTATALSTLNLRRPHSSRRACGMIKLFMVGPPLTRSQTSSLAAQAGKSGEEEVLAMKVLSEAAAAAAVCVCVCGV